MAIDNVLLLLLVPWAGAASDRASAVGRGRLPIIAIGLVLAAAGMALFPLAATLGVTGLIVAIVVLHTGINIQRSPFQALVADLIPSRYRSLATGSATFQMCVGAVVFLMLGQWLGMRVAFFIAAAVVLAIAAALAVGLHEPAAPEAQAAEASYRSLFNAGWSALCGRPQGLRAIFVATLLLQLTFQTFTTWYALHGMERFGVLTEAVTRGFIAWAMGGVIGAVPSGMIGMRIGRRNAMLLGFGLMALCMIALNTVTDISRATPLLALASASWTLPTVNAYPLFVEPIPRSSRGVLAALFLLSMALGGAAGDPLNGFLFHFFETYRPLFVLMTVYTSLAFIAVLFVPSGTGEADTGPDSSGHRVA
jgi:MFS family permease